MKNEKIRSIFNFLITSIIIISMLYLVSPEISEKEIPPCSCELTVSDKYIITYNFIFFEGHDYCFEFEENPYFESAILPTWNRSDYYEYEIGDNYTYYWVSEW